MSFTAWSWGTSDLRWLTTEAGRFDWLGEFTLTKAVPPVVPVNWSRWQDCGMSVDEAIRSGGMKAQSGFESIVAPATVAVSPDPPKSRESARRSRDGPPSLNVPSPIRPSPRMPELLPVSVRALFGPGVPVSHAVGASTSAVSVIVLIVTSWSLPTAMLLGKRIRRAEPEPQSMVVPISTLPKNPKSMRPKLPESGPLHGASLCPPAPDFTQAYPSLLPAPAGMPKGRTPPNPLPLVLATANAEWRISSNPTSWAKAVATY